MSVTHGITSRPRVIGILAVSNQPVQVTSSTEGRTQDPLRRSGLAWAPATAEVAADLKSLKAHKDATQERRAPPWRRGRHLPLHVASVVGLATSQLRSDSPESELLQGNSCIPCNTQDTRLWKVPKPMTLLYTHRVKAHNCIVGQ